MELGIIEGFYGRPWTWQDRQETAAFLAPHGYGFYIYAPKADTYLRRRWQEPHPAAEARSMAALAKACRDVDVRFGVGLSPYEIYRSFDNDARAALADKLAFLDDVGSRILAVLFDDMRGDLPDLAHRQIGIIEWIAARTKAESMIVCPTYYSDDPVLDRVFGQRPPEYLETLGASLDPSIDIFWTGEEVVSREISIGHIERVTGQLRRKPFLWDNYPVNDGQRMSQYLHLRAFTGRPAALVDRLAAHGVNPALQPTLNRIPALTLVRSYEQGSAYEYGAALRRAAVEVMGERLGNLIYSDVLIMQDVGLDRLGDKEALLRKHYEGEDHPAAREIIDWLEGGYRITDEIVHTQ